MPSDIRKTKIPMEYLHRDLEGTDATVVVPTSTGDSRAAKKLNASHIPLRVATRALKGAADTVLTATDVDAAIAFILNEMNQIGIPDNITLQFLLGVLQIKDEGVSTGKLDQTPGTEAVSSVTIRDDAVITAKINDLAVTTAKLALLSVDTGQLAGFAVTGPKIAAGTITKDKLDTASVGKTQLDMDGVGTPPSHFVIASDVHILGGGAATEIEAISGAPGVLVTDRLQATVRTGTTTEALLTAEITDTDEITYTFDANIPASTEVTFTVFRPTA